MNAALDLQAVRSNLRLMLERGFDRGENLLEKLTTVIARAQADQPD